MNDFGQESATLEFKRELPQGQHIAKTLVAFCNGFGGRIILGIDDHQHICGLPEAGIDEMISALQQSIYHHCTPTVLPSIYTQRVEDKLLLIIEVSSGMNKPYFVTALGVQEGTFIRAGAHTVKANATMIQELIWKGKGLSTDEMPQYSATPQDLAEDQFQDFLKTHRSAYQVGGTTDLLLHYKILVEEHGHRYPSTAGLLLFGKAPQRFLPEAFIICTHFQGTSGRNALASQDCTGSLLNQVETALHFVKSRLTTRFDIEGTQRTQSLEIPEIALREIIINAIVHRDYHLAGPIKIAIYDHQVEIFSPGNFPGPLKTTQLEMGITYIRNHVLCKIFREAGYIEKLGSGFLTLFQSYRSAGLKDPEVIEGVGFIKCILPRTPKTPDMTITDNDAILHLFHFSEHITPQDVMKALSISRQTATRRLSAMLASGQLKRLGRGPMVRYRKG